MGTTSRPLLPVVLEVYDADVVTQDDFLGAAVVPIAHFPPGRPVFLRLCLVSSGQF